MEKWDELRLSNQQAEEFYIKNSQVFGKGGPTPTSLKLLDVFTTDNPEDFDQVNLDQLQSHMPNLMIVNPKTQGNYAN